MRKFKVTELIPLGNYWSYFNSGKISNIVDHFLFLLLILTRHSIAKIKDKAIIYCNDIFEGGVNKKFSISTFD